MPAAPKAQGSSTSPTTPTRPHPYANGARSTRKATQTPAPAAPVDDPYGLDGASPDEDAEAVAPTSSKRKRKSGSAAHQPKSSRQQFSACHACRYRRVKCDLKDLAQQNPSEEPSCTNCRERGLRCKDDYAENKRQLRRGKRINQLELEDTQSVDGVPIYRPPTQQATVIPTLKADFFASPFFRRFHVQRPIIDPGEFKARYIAWLQHYQTPDSHAGLSSAAAPLSPEGQLIAKLLVIWAAAYGVDEAGVEEPLNSFNEVHRRRMRVKAMVEEILRMIDSMGLLRKPSWDGVRVLLLTLPLTEDAIDNPMDRLAMYEGAIQQVYTLCQYDTVGAGITADNSTTNALVRARIFWYAHVHEGLTTGLRGGRLLLSDDDLKTFQDGMLPHYIPGNNNALQPSSATYSFALQYATAPIRLASACRLIHSALTGPKARASKVLDGKKLEAAWEALAQCWEEFESLRSLQRNDYVTPEESTRFADGWQIFLFECLNVIQNKIEERLDAAESAQVIEYDSPDAVEKAETFKRDLKKYVQIAEGKVYDSLNHVVTLVRRNLKTSFFAYDASLVRDGCFWAGRLLSDMPGRDDDIRACLQALSEMRWAFSKGQDRAHTIEMLRAARDAGAAAGRKSFEYSPPTSQVVVPGDEFGQAITPLHTAHFGASSAQRASSRSPLGTTSMPSRSPMTTPPIMTAFEAQHQFFSQPVAQTRAPPPTKLNLGPRSATYVETPLGSASTSTGRHPLQDDLPHLARWSPPGLGQGSLTSASSDGSPSTQLPDLHAMSHATANAPYRMASKSPLSAEVPLHSRHAHTQSLGAQQQLDLRHFMRDTSPSFANNYALDALHLQRSLPQNQTFHNRAASDGSLGHSDFRTMSQYLVNPPNLSPDFVDGSEYFSSNPSNFTSMHHHDTLHHQHPPFGVEPAYANQFYFTAQ